MDTRQERIFIKVKDVAYFSRLFRKERENLFLITPQENDPLYNCIAELDLNPLHKKADLSDSETTIVLVLKVKQMLQIRNLSIKKCINCSSHTL